MGMEKRRELIGIAGIEAEVDLTRWNNTQSVKRRNKFLKGIHNQSQ